jgi:uncharacterized protein YukE
MRTYTKELFHRILWLGLWLTIFIFFLIYWFINNPITEISKLTFTPEKKINELVQIQNILSNPIDLVIEKPLSCDARPLSILKIELIDHFNLNIEQTNHVLAQINSQLNHRSNCYQLIDDVRTLAKIELKMSSNVSKKSFDIRQELTERVSWTRTLPCLYFKNGKGYGLTLGNAVDCARDFPFSRSGLELKKGGINLIVNKSKVIITNSNKSTLAAISSSPKTVTIDPIIQKKLDHWKNCFELLSCKSYDVSAVNHVSVVVLDVDNGDILGTICWSGLCDAPQIKDTGVLGALYIEVPPASTIKLLHALVIAKNASADNLLLMRQIKTSGQIPNKEDETRNEWWEKQSICDGQNITECRHPLQVADIASHLYWNGNCKLQSIQCGKISLVDGLNNLILSGLIGRVKTSSQTNIPSSFLDWSTYNEIRRGKRKKDGSVKFLNTSLSVQSVIGAADSRISALGLAGLSMNIYQISRNQPTLKPLLIRSLVSLSSQSAVSEIAGFQQAAQIVLGGMRKVVEPPEPGWTGPGTAAGAFTRAFGKSCVSECGVWAKTGTVSEKDKLPDTTLLTTLVDTADLAKWQAVNSDNQHFKHLAMGVVVVPKKGFKHVHHASELGMKILHDLSTEEQ